MKYLIEHILRNNTEEVLAKSLRNCHVPGVNSIMLLESPGKTIRLYVTDPMHELWQNRSDKQTLAFHPHHCNLTLEVVRGSITNINAFFRNEKEIKDEQWNIGEKTPVYQKYLYRSKITKGQMAFKHIGEELRLGYSEMLLNEGQSIALGATDIHTVHVDRFKTAAWLVYEGKENYDHKSYCWTNSDPNTQIYSDLYQPMDLPMIEYYLKEAGLI